MAKRLTNLRPTLSMFDTSIASVPAHRPDPFYQTAEWRTIRARIVKRDNYQCTARDCTTPRRGYGGRLIVDHIVAKRDGGTNDDHNLRTLCAPCDNRRHPEKGGAR